jgi:DNA repair photolyase
MGGTVITGRAALSNRESRYSNTTVEWDDGVVGPSPVTECVAETARSIIASNQSPDVPFDQSINPYRGCEHGCVYCYARPTHAWLDLSPGLDFETRLSYKSNAAILLDAELRKQAYRCSPITIGANTDPYQPVERDLRITRELLETLQRFRHPFSLITKGSLVERDIDILAEMAADNLCSVAISITTLDGELKRRMEPRAASAQARLNCVEKLSAAGVPVAVLVAPVIPSLNDQDMEKILAAGATAGAQSANYILLRLPLEIRDLFREWLREHYPLREEHVFSLLRQSRGGRDNDPRFGHRMRGQGVFADLLAARFRAACKKHGLRQRENSTLSCEQFSIPPAAGDQYTLF